MPVAPNNLLGTYLKDRRTRLDPAAFGFSVGRRRTPGLRREEVAQRSNISPTWYTWLEQGRGGAPSADVLNRIAAALMLTDAPWALARGRATGRRGFYLGAASTLFVCWPILVTAGVQAEHGRGGRHRRDRVGEPVLLR